MLKEKVAYSVREAAELLGLHENTIRKLIWRGELKAARLGRRVVIPRTALEAVLGETPRPEAGEK